MITTTTTEPLDPARDLPVRAAAPQARRIAWERHRPVLIALRNRILRHSGEWIDGIAFVSIAAIAALVQQLARAHHLVQPMPDWTGAVWLCAYAGSWALFALGAAQSLAFGVALLAFWFVADLVGVDPASSDTLLLLALVAVAARVLALLVTLGRAHLRH